MRQFITVLIFITLSTILHFGCSSIEDEVKYTKKNDGRMYLKANYFYESDGNIKFVLIAERIRVLEEEYLPSSEDFRIVLFNDYSELIFNSDFEKNFLMVIKDVEPKFIGDTKKHEYVWNKKSNQGKAVPPGMYKANLLIPAMPTPYSILLDVEIK